MSLESLDKNIKSSMYSYESGVPAGMWDAIDNQLRPKKHRWLLWFFTSIAVLGISILLKLNLDTSQSSKSAYELVDAPINLDKSGGLPLSIEADATQARTPNITP